MAEESRSPYHRDVLGLLRIQLLIVSCVLGVTSACRGSADVVVGTTETPAPASSMREATSVAAVPTSVSVFPLEPTATTGGLPIDELPRIEFIRSDGTVASFPIEVPSRSEYGVGLSGRYELNGRGMLFHYPDAKTVRGFYMKNTHVELDIAFVGADFTIQEIIRMDADSLEIRRPAEAYQYAVEAPAGWYAENGVEVGDIAKFTFDLDDFS
jgi:uncharacterized membrane protein (UPF0127 family)